MKKSRRPESRGKSNHVQGGRGRTPLPPRGRGGPPQPSPTSRQPHGRCVVGIHAVEEVLRVRPRSVEQLWMRAGYEDHPSLATLHEQAEEQRVRVQIQPLGVLDKVVGAHQGVLAFSNEEPELDWQALIKREVATVIALDEVEDPHNLGAVLRTAWLLGAEAVFTPEHRAAQLSPAVSKVAQGAVEHVPVVRDGALPQQLLELKDNGFWILGLSHRARQPLYGFEVPAKVVWVLGSESSGMRKSVEGVCDDLILIPQLAPEASYNVSVAAALALGETHRQRASLR